MAQNLAKVPAATASPSLKAPDSEGEDGCAYPDPLPPKAKPHNKPLPRKSLGKPGPPSSAPGTDQRSKQRIPSGKPGQQISAELRDEFLAFQEFKKQQQKN
mmetsp:Transcript_22168/g.57820  ORF Transcript_22168/g.57820 Transcript_22168/m.57820 type:complete len:101 (-) Transcript_22168:47-349(-)